MLVKFEATKESLEVHNSVTGNTKAPWPHSTKILLPITSFGRVVGTEFYVLSAYSSCNKIYYKQIQNLPCSFFFLFKLWCEINLPQSLIFSYIRQENVMQSVLFFPNRHGEVENVLAPCIFQQRVAVHCHTPTVKEKFYSNICGLCLQGKNPPCRWICFGGEMGIGL